MDEVQVWLGEETTLLSLTKTKSTNAVVDDTLTWTAVEGATTYKVSTNGFDWTNIGNITSYDYTQVYNTNLIYISAFNGSECIACGSVSIDKKVMIAGEGADYGSAGITVNNKYNSSVAMSSTTKKYGSTAVQFNIKSNSGSNKCALDYYFNSNKYNYYSNIGASKIKYLTMWVYVTGVDNFYTPEATSTVYNWGNGISGVGNYTVKDGGYGTGTWVQLKFDMTSLESFVSANGFRCFVYTTDRAFDGTSSENYKDVTYTVYMDEVQVWYE